MTEFSSPSLDALSAAIGRRVPDLMIEVREALAERVPDYADFLAAHEQEVTVGVLGVLGVLLTNDGEIERPGEREFFENHASYKSKAQFCGTPFLARKLNMVRTLIPKLVSAN